MKWERERERKLGRINEAETVTESVSEPVCVYDREREKETERLLWWPALGIRCRSTCSVFLLNKNREDSTKWNCFGQGKEQGGRHTIVVLPAPTILRPWVQIPSITITLFKVQCSLPFIGLKLYHQGVHTREKTITLISIYIVVIEIVVVIAMRKGRK